MYVRFYWNLCLNMCTFFQGNKLSDIKLMVVILLMLLPVATILIIWSAFDNIRMDFSHAVQDSEVLAVLQPHMHILVL